MGYKSEMPFGMDIGDRSLKVLQYKMLQNGTLTITGLSVLEIPPGLIKDGEILNPGELVSRIREITRKAHIISEQVMIALPESKTFLKLLHVSKEQTVPLQKIVESELTKHLPYNINEVQWDFTVVKTNETKADVLAGAAPKKLVETYTALLKEAGLTPVIADLEPLAIARALIKKQTIACTMIVDLGATKSTLILATADAVLGTADGKSRADDLTAQIAATLKIDLSAAEEMKRKYGMQNGSPEYQVVLSGYLSALTRRMQDVISFSVNHELLCPAVSEILLSGGGALLKGLPEALAGVLKIPVKIADPWANVQVRSELAVNSATGLRFVSACGLALTALQYEHRSIMYA